MSHELRTPLGIILGYLEILLAGGVGELSPPQKDILQKLDRASGALFELINMVLNVSRLQAGGQLPLDVRKVRVGRELLAEVQIELQGLCEQSRLSCLWQVAADLPPLYIDPGKLEVVIKNLVNNAVKFTPEGSVTITAEEQGGGVEIRVADTGIGIPVEVQASSSSRFAKPIVAYSPVQRQRAGPVYCKAFPREDRLTRATAPTTAAAPAAPPTKKYAGTSHVQTGGFRSGRP